MSAVLLGFRPSWTRLLRALSWRMPKPSSSLPFLGGVSASLPAGCKLQGEWALPCRHCPLLRGRATCALTAREGNRTQGSLTQNPTTQWLPKPTFESQPHPSQKAMQAKQGQPRKAKLQGLPALRSHPRLQGPLTSPMETDPRASPPPPPLPLEHTGMDTQSCSSCLGFART